MKLAVFVGTRGRGSNLRAIRSAIASGRLDAEIVAVIGSQADAPAMVWAREAGLSTVRIDPRRHDEAAYAEKIAVALTDSGADAIALAGYMRRLPEIVVDRWRHRIVNIHPALLPAFGGKGMYGHHVHEAVIAMGCKVSGCTAHLVDEAYDTGPILLQKCVAVDDTDTPDSLAAKILPLEHETLVEALALIGGNRVTVEGRRTRIRN